MIDNPPEINQGLFKIGKKLDANSNVTGGWSDWVPVPDWFSWENQGLEWPLLIWKIRVN